MRFPSLRRSRIAILAFLAALAVLLQPLCTAYAAAGHADEATPCCEQIDADAAVPNVPVEKADAGVPPLPLMAAAVMAPRARADWYRLAAWKDRPPPPLPYHARSARIQR